MNTMQNRTVPRLLMAYERLKSSPVSGSKKGVYPKRMLDIKEELKKRGLLDTTFSQYLDKLSMERVKKEEPKKEEPKKEEPKKEEPKKESVSEVKEDSEQEKITK